MNANRDAVVATTLDAIIDKVLSELTTPKTMPEMIARAKVLALAAGITMDELDRHFAPNT